MRVGGWSSSGPPTPRVADPACLVRRQRWPSNGGVPLRAVPWCPAGPMSGSSGPRGVSGCFGKVTGVTSCRSWPPEPGVASGRPAGFWLPAAWSGSLRASPATVGARLDLSALLCGEGGSEGRALVLGVMPDLELLVAPPLVGARESTSRPGHGRRRYPASVAVSWIMLVCRGRLLGSGSGCGRRGGGGGSRCLPACRGSGVGV